MATLATRIQSGASSDTAGPEPPPTMAKSSYFGNGEDFRQALRYRSPRRGPKPFSAEFGNLLEIFNDVGVEDLFTEALDERVRIRLAWLNVARIDAVALTPVQKLPGDELRSVVHAQRSWKPRRSAAANY